MSSKYEKKAKTVKESFIGNRSKLSESNDQKVSYECNGPMLTIKETLSKVSIRIFTEGVSFCLNRCSIFCRASSIFSCCSRSSSFTCTVPFSTTPVQYTKYHSALQLFVNNRFDCYKVQRTLHQVRHGFDRYWLGLVSTDFQSVGGVKATCGVTAALTSSLVGSVSTTSLGLTCQPLNWDCHVKGSVWHMVLAIDASNLSTLMLLDLSTAFDTADNSSFIDLKPCSNDCHCSYLGHSAMPCQARTKSIAVWSEDPIHWVFILLTFVVPAKWLRVSFWFFQLNDT